MKLSKCKLLQLLLIQEIRTILGSHSLWGLLIILSLLTGYSFIEAVDLFSQASQTALSYPDLASGMIPMDGIFVPTFGAYYLVETLLLPFVVIRVTGQDKLNGTLKLLLQLPVSSSSLNGVKLTAMGVVWLLMLLPGFSVFFLWNFMGGAVYLPAIFMLLLGHALYSLTITCIAMFAAAVSSSLATAAMISLTITLGSWVLDFATGSNTGWLQVLNDWSLTTLLRQFESGLFSSNALCSFFLISLFFFITASIWLHPGQKIFRKIKAILLTTTVLLLIASGAMRIPIYLDVTENHKHSFNPSDVRALHQMEKLLTITVHLSPEDSRFYDLKHEVLEKLQRIVPHMQVIFAAPNSTGFFGSSDDEKYGLIEYNYGGEHDSSYSNSSLEILPILHSLARQKVVLDQMQSYPGYPLVADASWTRWWFYILLPLLLLLSDYLLHKPPKLPRTRR